jgi:hypothetical protein
MGFPLELPFIATSIEEYEVKSGTTLSKGGEVVLLLVQVPENWVEVAKLAEELELLVVAERLAVEELVLVSNGVLVDVEDNEMAEEDEPDEELAELAELEDEEEDEAEVAGAEEELTTLEAEDLLERAT